MSDIFINISTINYVKRCRYLTQNYKTSSVTARIMASYADRAVPARTVTCVHGPPFIYPKVKLCDIQCNILKKEDDVLNIMAKAVNVSLRIDEDVKRESEELFGELGLTLSAAVNVFLRQAIRHGGLPFEVRVDAPNRDTMMAIEEARRISADPGVRGMTYEEYLREMNP